MSAAYIDIELQSEFGQIPPSFLPLGNKRLFQHQNNLIPSSLKKYISIPENYIPSIKDTSWLKNNNFNIISVPVNLSIGESLVATINQIDDSFEKPLHILFGDTIISPLPKGNDIIAVSSVNEDYKWATISDRTIDIIAPDANNLNGSVVIAGYFKFCYPRKLICQITKNHWDFIKGINQYNKKNNCKFVTVEKWLDFGHVNTYYQSKAKFTTQRSFNDLVINTEWIEKSSSNNKKIIAEANWYEKVPYEIKEYIPQYLGSKNNNNLFSYRLEYLYLTALNELFVFSKLSPSNWKKIFDSCFKFINKCKSYSLDNGSPHSRLSELLNKKTIQRLNYFFEKRGFDYNTNWNYKGECISISKILDIANNWIPKDVITANVMHGDFCFSNILFDFRSNRIKTIDPRGITNNNDYSIYGDSNYDIAKLSHSVLGLYDFIISGYYSVNIVGNTIEFDIFTNNSTNMIQKMFIEKVYNRYSLNEKNLYAMQIHLFLSMLPLHDDDINRQNALFSNVFRLYKILKDYSK